MSVTPVNFVFVDYDIAYSDVQQVFRETQAIYQKFTEVGADNVLARIYSYFYNGLLYTISADQHFKNKDYEKAFHDYEEGHKLLVRARASRGREGDEIYNEMTAWENYSDGMKKLTQALLSGIESTGLIQEAISSFEEYTKIMSNKGEFFKILAKARIFLANYFLYKFKAEQAKNNSNKYKKELLAAIRSLKKANFILGFLDEELDEAQNDLDEITKVRIVVRAEKFWNMGSEQIMHSNFSKAQKFFSIASQYYVRASEICSDFLEQRLYLALSKITLASEYESRANELYKRLDMPAEASTMFENAFNIVDDAIGLLVTINSETLIKSMTAQRSFYEALMFQTKGIAFFDKEEFQKALEYFDKAMKKYSETQKLATDAELDQLQEFLKQYKSELEGYITMAKAML